MSIQHKHKLFYYNIMYYLKYKFNKQFTNVICSNVYSKGRKIFPDLKIYNNNEGFKLDIIDTYKIKPQTKYYKYIPYISHRIILFGSCKCNTKLICCLYNIDSIIKWSDDEIKILLELINNEAIFFNE